MSGANQDIGNRISKRVFAAINTFITLETSAAVDLVHP
jgi:hypothetical protein